MEDQKSKNLSETLFAKHHQAKETSGLVQYMPSSLALLQQRPEHSWYRNLRRLQWIWQGADPIVQEQVLARISSSEHSRTNDNLLDTVMGFRKGNWAYEWTHEGMKHQKLAQELKGEEASLELYRASLYFSIAAYPHIRGDNLASQAQVLANKAYEEASEKSQYVFKQLKIPHQGKTIEANLHLPHTERPLPVVIVCGGLDSVQTDMWKLFLEHLAPNELAMLTIDMPSVGKNSHWTLTEDTSVLHKAVLDFLPTVPYVDHWKVGLLGFRFGGNALVRLSFLEQQRIKACVALGAPVHDILSSADKMKSMPKMYLDVLGSRLGKSAVDIHSLAAQMSAWSLRTQGLLASRKTKVPILAVSLEGDPVAPHSDNKLVAMSSQYGEAVKIPSKNLSAGYQKSLDLAVDWLITELKS
ncbi:fermentation/respiration switch protein [Vibrio ishigakensis]|uniref:Fermentation/respiration switch protein n=1 Tax=Vibrio ishigakensis TaxID=1481914 RepID=A0A0B8QCR2_9VIBR|nr:fermentation/respiration switch protein [Vibrio ishigakensis]